MDFNIEKLLAWRCCLNYPGNIKWIDLKNESTVNLKKNLKKNHHLQKKQIVIKTKKQN